MGSRIILMNIKKQLTKCLNCTEMQRATSISKKKNYKVLEII
jgi:hypothetical protein